MFSPCWRPAFSKVFHYYRAAKTCRVSGATSITISFIQNQSSIQLIPCRFAPLVWIHFGGSIIVPGGKCSPQRNVSDLKKKKATSPCPQGNQSEAEYNQEHQILATLTTDYSVAGMIITPAQGLRRRNLGPSRTLQFAVIMFILFADSKM